MSTRQLRARLNRLEKTSMPTAAKSGFRIDPALAKAIRDDQKRLDELQHSRTGAPSEEELMLRARIDRMADTIVCPPSYGAWQAREDKRLMRDSEVIADDAKHAQMAARVAAFDRTREGRARKRIADLEDQIDANNWGAFIAFLERTHAEGWKSPDERSEAMQACFDERGHSPELLRELEYLKTLYPDLPLDPNDQSLMRFCEAMSERGLM